MHPELQRYLDGEIPLEALPPELAEEARGWSDLLEDAAHLRAEVAPPWLEGLVMAALPARPREAAWARAARWLLVPHPISLRPITALAGAGALALALALWVRVPANGPAHVAERAPAPAAVNGGTVYVQFTLTAPGAHSVEVAGDFNGWQGARAQLRDPEGDGDWSGLIALPPGVHKYMFVIDGRRWVSDPHAHLFVDDGFGMKNSLIAIAPPTRSS